MGRHGSVTATTFPIKAKRKKSWPSGHSEVQSPSLCIFRNYRQSSNNRSKNRKKNANQHRKPEKQNPCTLPYFILRLKKKKKKKTLPLPFFFFKIKKKKKKKKKS